jgi:hypothetical protein
MDVDRFIERVTVKALVVLLLATLMGWGIWGVTGAAGVTGAGGLALLNFRRLARGAARATAGNVTGRAYLLLGVRHLGMLAALGALLATGWVNPIAVVVGVTVLPPVLVAHGLARSDH